MAATATPKCENAPALAHPKPARRRVPALMPPTLEWPLGSESVGDWVYEMGAPGGHGPCPSRHFQAPFGWLPYQEDGRRRAVAVLPKVRSRSHRRLASPRTHSAPLSHIWRHSASSFPDSAIQELCSISAAPFLISQPTASPNLNQEACTSGLPSFISSPPPVDIPLTDQHPSPALLVAPVGLHPQGGGS